MTNMEGHCKPAQATIIPKTHQQHQQHQVKSHRGASPASQTSTRPIKLKQAATKKIYPKIVASPLLLVQTPPPVLSTTTPVSAQTPPQTDNVVTETTDTKMTKTTTTIGAKIKLHEINPYLTCHLCKGYLIDVTTISECLHSFCRSCIIRFLQENSHCPVCELVINKAKPNLKLDKTLQDIVYKLVPELFVSEMKRRREFYRQHHPHEAQLVSPEQRGEDTERTIFNARDTVSLCLEYISDDSSPGAILFLSSVENATLTNNVTTTTTTTTINGNHNKVTPARDCPSDIDEESQATAAMKRFLLCPGLCRVDVLKKFVAKKYNVDTLRFHIDVLYKRIPLPEHYTLIDIAYIYSWKRNEPMKLFFRITDLKVVKDRFDYLEPTLPSAATPQLPTAQQPLRTALAASPTLSSSSPTPTLSSSSSSLASATTPGALPRKSPTASPSKSPSNKSVTLPTNKNSSPSTRKVSKSARYTVKPAKSSELSSPKKKPSDESLGVVADGKDRKYQTDQAEVDRAIVDQTKVNQTKVNQTEVDQIKGNHTGIVSKAAKVYNSPGKSSSGEKSVDGINQKIGSTLSSSASKSEKRNSNLIGVKSDLTVKTGDVNTSGNDENSEKEQFLKSIELTARSDLDSSPPKNKTKCSESEKRKLSPQTSPSSTTALNTSLNSPKAKKPKLTESSDSKAKRTSPKTPKIADESKKRKKRPQSLKKTVELLKRATDDLRKSSEDGRRYEDFSKPCQSAEEDFCKSPEVFDKSIKSFEVSTSNSLKKLKTINGSRKSSDESIKRTKSKKSAQNLKKIVDHLKKDPDMDFRKTLENLKISCSSKSTDDLIKSAEQYGKSTMEAYEKLADVSIKTTEVSQSREDPKKSFTDQRNLKNLLNTCKIPSSLSITCVNSDGEQRESLPAKPVINHIEILKLPDVPSKNLSEEEITSSTKDITDTGLNGSSAVLKGNNKSKGSSITITLESASKDTSSTTVQDLKDSNELKVPSVMVHKPGIHPNLPKILPSMGQPSKNLSKSTMGKQPAANKTAFDKLQSGGTEKTTSVVSKRNNLLEIASQLICKKSKLDEQSLPQNLSGKVAIPRLPSLNGKSINQQLIQRQNREQTGLQVNSNQGSLNRLESGLVQKNLGISTMGQTNLGPGNHGQSNHGQTNHGQTNLGQTNHGEANHGQSSHGQSNQGQSNQGQSNHGQSNFEQSNLVQANLGQTNLLLTNNPHSQHNPNQSQQNLESFNLHSNALSMNYSVSISQNSSKKKPVNKEKPPNIQPKNTSPEFKATTTTKSTTKSTTTKSTITTTDKGLAKILPKKPTSPTSSSIVSSSSEKEAAKLDLKQLQEKYNIQNLAQLSASINFPTSVPFAAHLQQQCNNVTNSNPLAAIQQAMILKHLEMQTHQHQQQQLQNQRPNWFSTSSSTGTAAVAAGVQASAAMQGPASPLAQYEKFLRDSLVASANSVVHNNNNNNNNNGSSVKNPLNIIKD